MTHTEISETAGLRLEELTSLYLNDAVRSCVIDSVKGDSLAELILGVSEHITEGKKIEYFAEATVSKKTNPEKVAENRLKNGFTTGGVNIDINKAPVWNDYKSSTRNTWGGE